MTNHGHQAHIIHGHTGAHTLPRPHILSRLTTDRRSMRTGSPLPGPELRTTRYRAARSHDLQTVLLQDRLALPRQHFRVSHHAISIRSHFNLHSAQLSFSSRRFFPCRLIPPFSYFRDEIFIFRCKIGRARSASGGGGGWQSWPGLHGKRRDKWETGCGGFDFDATHHHARNHKACAGIYPPVLGRRGERPFA